MKKLIINCDDLGISKETNLGIVDCLFNKKASSSSIIANGEFFNDAVQSIKQKIPGNMYIVSLVKILKNAKKIEKKSNSFFLFSNHRINKIIENKAKI